MPQSSSRIQEFLDRADLARLVTEIGRCLDTKEFDGLTRLYTADAALSMPGVGCAGAADIVDVARRSHEIFQETQHFVSCPAVEPDGDRARVVANVFAALIPADASQTRMVGSRYELIAVRGADGWRFAEHVITPVWDLPRS